MIGHGSNTLVAAEWSQLLREKLDTTNRIAWAFASTKKSQRRPEFQRILVPVDFSVCSAIAVTKAVALARRYHAHVGLLYVVDLNFNCPPTGPANTEKLKANLWNEGLSKLGEAIQELSGQHLELQVLIREGLPCDEIVAAARNFDLIVIGAHKHRPFTGLFSRHTASAVLKHAPCPVLIVREENEVEPPHPTNQI